MGFIIVEVCDSNPASALNLEFLETLYPGVTVLRSECMSKCGLCEHNVYAYVNGQIVFAKDANTCMAQICVQIEQELADLGEV